MSRKTIIITGDSGGIGNAISRLLDDEYNILGLSRSTGFDISNRRKLESLPDCDVYGIVNNAACCIKKPFYQYTFEDWEKTVNTNIRPVWFLAKKFHNKLIKNKGVIVNVSSIHSVASLIDNELYAMSKGAMESLTRSLALYFAPYGVRVNCVRPGPVMTSMLQYKPEMEKSVPLGRIASPMEIADVVFFLLSKQASYITGECISVDGGVLSKLSVSG